MSKIKRKPFSFVKSSKSSVADIPVRKTPEEQAIDSMFDEVEVNTDEVVVEEIDESIIEFDVQRVTDMWESYSLEYYEKFLPVVVKFMAMQDAIKSIEDGFVSSRLDSHMVLVDDGLLDDLVNSFNSSMLHIMLESLIDKDMTEEMKSSLFEELTKNRKNKSTMIEAMKKVFDRKGKPSEISADDSPYGFTGDKNGRVVKRK